MRAHPNLPGPLAEGSALADKFTQFTTLSQLELAQQSYAMYHHNSKSLRKQFGLTQRNCLSDCFVKECDIFACISSGSKTLRPAS